MLNLTLQRAEVYRLVRRWWFASIVSALLIAAGGLGAAAWVLGGSGTALGTSDNASTRLPGASLLLAMALSLAATSTVFLSTLALLRRQLALVVESRERNRAIVDNMVDGAIHIDAQGRIVALNAAAERMFGRDSASVRDAPLSVLLDGGHRDEIESLIGTAAGDSAPVNVSRELTGRRADGDAFPLYLALSEVDIGAQPVFTAIARDLTETRRRMEELAGARDQAMAADRAKSQFLAVMSHEIRTPMNGILGMLDLLRDDNLSARQREFIDTAEQSGKVLLGMINDILDLSNIEAGKLKLQQIDFDLHATVEDVTSLAAGHARDKDLEVVCWIEQGVPANVIGDPFRLRQVLTKLTNNALKFTQRGEVLVHVTAETITDADARIRVSVRDTGIGIEASVRRMLFKPFSQGDASNTRRYGGTGLGLAISKRLVDLMGGEIGVDSTPGEGAKFWFTLRLQRGGDEAAESADLRGVRVLIVDDNASNRLVLESYLGNWGADSEGVASGIEALRALQRAKDSGSPFALAILDLQLPEMDGIELAEHIKADPNLASTRLLLLSPPGLPGADARRAGIGVALLKPVRRSLLHATALEVLSRSEDDNTRHLPAPSGAQFRARVLVAEDNPDDQRVVVSMLERFGLEAQIAQNGRVAVETLAGDHGFDLVLMDTQMSELNGPQATREVRMQERRGGLAPVPIIALTATADERTACFTAGMDDLLAKPVQRDALEAALRRWLPPQAAQATAGGDLADSSCA